MIEGKRETILADSTPTKRYRYEGVEHDADELIMDVESRFRSDALLLSIVAPKRFVFHANGSAASDLERFSVRADIEAFQIGGLNVSPDLAVFGGHLCLRLGKFLGPCGC